MKKIVKDGDGKYYVKENGCNPYPLMATSLKKAIRECRENGLTVKNDGHITVDKEGKCE